MVFHSFLNNAVAFVVKLRLNKSNFLYDDEKHSSNQFYF